MLALAALGSAWSLGALWHFCFSLLPLAESAYSEGSLWFAVFDADFPFLFYSCIGPAQCCGHGDEGVSVPSSYSLPPYTVRI